MNTNSIDMAVFTDLAGAISTLKDKISLLTTVAVDARVDIATLISSVDGLEETISSGGSIVEGSGRTNKESVFESDEIIQKVEVTTFSTEAVEMITKALLSPTMRGDVNIASKKDGGGLLGKLGGLGGGGVGGAMLTGGLGIGAAGLGVGAAAAGLGYLVDKMANVDGKRIKETVLELVSINDALGGRGESFKDGGVLAVVLGGIGLGLAAFSIGAGSAAVVAKFTDDIDWVGNVRSNVTQLMMINQDLKKYGGLGGGLTLGAVLGAIGAGLAVFGAGSAIAGLGGALTNFSKKNWASDIVENVSELLSINALFKGTWDAFKKSGTFFVAMSGIAAGLAVFGVGSAIGGIGNAIVSFSKKDWGRNIADNVSALLSIDDSVKGKGGLIGKSALFLLAMTGIGAGLAVFGAGSAIAGLSDGLLHFTSPNWALSIISNVKTLLSIEELLSGKSLLIEGGKFFAAMTAIGSGLAVFGAGGIVNSFSEGVGKLFGGTSPVDKIIGLANSADALKGVGDSFRNMASGLDQLSKSFKDFDSTTTSGSKRTFEFLKTISVSDKPESQPKEVINGELKTITGKLDTLITSVKVATKSIGDEIYQAITDIKTDYNDTKSFINNTYSTASGGVPRGESSYDRAFDIRSRYWTAYTRGY